MKITIGKYNEFVKKFDMGKHILGNYFFSQRFGQAFYNYFGLSLNDFSNDSDDGWFYNCENRKEIVDYICDNFIE